MTVLDASSILAVVQREPGADVVAKVMRGALLGAANLAEVIGKTVDAGKDPRRLRALLSSAGVVVVSVEDGDALLAGAMRAIPGGKLLSLGDRLCLALAIRSDPPEVLTADRAWLDVGLPLTVRLIR